MSFQERIQRICRPFLKLFYRVEVIGNPFCTESGPVVLCPNHTSYMDVPVLYLTLKRPPHFMAKEELFHFKPMGWFLKKCGAFPVKRGTGDMAAIKKALYVLKQGELLAIFPQGTRTESVEVDEAKAGAVFIASMAKAPIVPVAITGGYRFRAKVKIHFGEPIYFDKSHKKYSTEEIKEISLILMGRIKRMTEEENESNRS